MDREAELKRLMLRGLDGDPGAWRMLLTQLRGALTPYFRRRLSGLEADAEDLVQDCLIAIHAKRATYDRSMAFTAWAYAIARYKLIDHFRRQGAGSTCPGGCRRAHGGAFRRGRRGPAGPLEGPVHPADASASPDRRRAYRGFSLAEAAARNGCTEGAAKVSVHRSMKALSASVISHED